MSTAAISTRVGRELGSICGVEHVTEAPAETIQGCAASVAVRPGSAEEIASVVRFANENNLTVVPAGGFTQQQTGATAPQIDILLYTSRLTQVEHYDPADLTVGIGAGQTVAKLCEMIRTSGLLFAGDPPAWQQATIGGLLATGITGPRRHGFGGLRDYCIGIHFVTGDGRIGKGGGRVVKNVAGYDMMKLLIGSWGTLGIITGASFKLFPRSPQKRTFVAEFPALQEAIDYRNAVLQSPLAPMCLELISAEAGGMLPAQGSAAWSVYVRGAGSDAVLGRYRSVLGGAVAREIEGDEEDAFWRAVADLPHALWRQRPESLLLSFSVPLSDVLPVLNDATAVAERNGLNLAAIGRVGVGHVLVALWPAGAGTGSTYVSAVSALRERLPRDASMVVLHCPAAVQKEIGVLRTPTHVESMRAVKRALDAKDILNRGRFSL
ncbi:MAG TPA: FAD-binding oxidoreductase [Bryocella sp.]|nr:FAD-binding oxidoreductase [Bryocella sp.]